MQPAWNQPGGQFSSAAAVLERRVMFVCFIMYFLGVSSKIISGGKCHFLSFGRTDHVRISYTAVGHYAFCLESSLLAIALAVFLL